SRMRHSAGRTIRQPGPIPRECLMRLKEFALVVIAAAAISQVSFGTSAQTADVKAAYERVDSFNRRTQGLVVNETFLPTFVENSSKLWYRRSVTGGNEFILVDVTARTKGPAFDHARLASALASATKASYTAVTLPFSTFTFTSDMQAIEFTIAGAGRGRAAGAGGGRQGAVGPAPEWRCTVTDYSCTRIAPTGPARQARPRR